MKKVKIAIWLIILVFAGVFIYQNNDFFMAKQSLRLNLVIIEPVHTPELHNVILFLVFFLTGFLIAYFISLSDRFKSKKTIKSLNADTASQRDELEALKRELELVRGGSSGGGAEGDARSTKTQSTEESA